MRLTIKSTQSIPLHMIYTRHNKSPILQSSCCARDRRRTGVYTKVLDLRKLSIPRYVALSSPFATPYTYLAGIALAMEYHSVPPEERARDEKGNLLPWGYVYQE